MPLSGSTFSGGGHDEQYPAEQFTGGNAGHAPARGAESVLRRASPLGRSAKKIMHSKASTIAEYLAGLPEKDREVIAALEVLVRRALPNAIPSMKYGMPTFIIGDRMIAFNSQKNYFSFYADPAIVKTFRSALKTLSVGKSCIRFTKLDSNLIETLIKIAAAYSK